MWTGSVSPVMRQKAKGSRPQRNLLRRANRRKVLAGYPVEPRSFSVDEIKSYFAGDKLVCLRCGKPYSKLGNHLHAIHSISDEEYKGMYGLPWTYGLTGTVAHENYRRSLMQRIADGWKPPNGYLPEKKTGGRIQPFRTEMAIRLLNRINNAR